MSVDARWAQIAADLEASRGEVPDQLRPALDQIEHIISARASQPEVAEAALEAIKAAAPHVSAGAEPATAVAAVEFAQGQWSPETVNNAQTIINLSIDPARGAAPEKAADVRAPVVLAVMTATDAEELCNGSAFEGYPEALANDFRQLDELLGTEQLSDWPTRYGTTALDWRPFGDDATISEIVNEAFASANERLEFKPPVVAGLMDVHELDRASLQKLRSQGCLVIVDCISLRHPKVQQAFHRSLLDAFPSTSVVALGPVKRAIEAARELTVVLQLRLDDFEIGMRRQDPYEDWGASAETADLAEFQKWVAGEIRRLAPGFGASGGIRSHMRISAP